ncbi:MAG: hypothetical protein LQ349_005767 [Xanthoria aureola]|nr:MAG: hypothetical protein LQ349_005767 [Xanthoria aureola]
MPNQRLSSRKFLMALLSVVLPVYLIFSLLSRAFPAGLPKPTSVSMTASNRSLVPLEAHIMSKCPDARDCLRNLVVPAMEQVVNKVNFTLSFIGSVDEDNSIQCMHGPGECLGDMLSLCAIDLHPDDPVIYLGFSNCLISSYAQIPSRDLVESCALEHGIAFEHLNGCISEEGKGLDLLMASVERSQAAGVKRSCTVRVNNKTWCVRDGGEWKDCPGGSDVKSLVEEVDRLYQM